MAFELFFVAAKLTRHDDLSPDPAVMWHFSVLRHLRTLALEVKPHEGPAIVRFTSHFFRAVE